MFFSSWGLDSGAVVGVITVLLIFFKSLCNCLGLVFFSWRTIAFSIHGVAGEVVVVVVVVVGDSVVLGVVVDVLSVVVGVVGVRNCSLTLFDCSSLPVLLCLAGTVLLSDGCISSSTLTSLELELELD